MKIALLVINRNGSGYLENCLNSLSSLNLDKHTMLVQIIDNASSDTSADLVAKKFPQFKLVLNPTDIGYSQALSLIIEKNLKQGFDYIWIIGSNSILPPDCLTLFQADSKAKNHANIFTCKMYFAPGHELYPDRYLPQERGKVIWFASGMLDWSSLSPSNRGINEVDKGQYDYDIQTDFIPQACMLIKREVFEKIGLFSPEYYYHLSEIDFSLRARNAGFKLIYLHAPYLWCMPEKTLSQSLGLDEYFITRNHLLLGLRHSPFYNKFSLLQNALHLYQQGTPWQKRAVMDYFSGRFGAGPFQT